MNGLEEMNILLQNLLVNTQILIIKSIPYTQSRFSK